jgi:hypothetical protein
MQNFVGEPLKKPLLVRPQVNRRMIDSKIYFRKIFVKIGD